MPLFTVDHDKCLRDGACVDVCPRYIIAPDAQGYPTPANGPDTCINCGHCVAVCPTGALSLATMPAAECTVVQPDLLPTATQVEHLLRARRSIRAFEDRAVPREVIAKLVDVARCAPTGSNRQPVEWLVVYDTAEVRRLAGLVEDNMRANASAPSYLTSLEHAKANGLDLVTRGAPHLIIAHAPKGSSGDGYIAQAFLEVAAFSLGLGACWAGFVNSAANSYAPMTEALGLPEGHAACGAMMVGYPRYHYQRIPERKPARVTWR